MTEPEATQRQRFLLTLTDVLRGSGDTRAILQEVSAMLGRHFGVNRVGYGHVDEQLDLIDYDVCWTDGSVPPLMGRFPASAFGQPVIDRLRAGEPVVIANVRRHPLTSDATTIKTSHEVDTRAILVVPLFKAGRLRTIVYLNQRPERDWTPHEVELMGEVAERTRELIERGRAEQALRESEARWRGLFERMGEGFFIGEALRDDAGRMVDFRFVEVNPAFERLTGIPVNQAVGRTVREAIPGVQDEVIDVYARVVDSGQGAEFELHVPALDDRWYDARARALGHEQFSVLFLEITERKAAETALMLSEARYRTLFESIDEGFCILQMVFDAAGQAHDYRFLEINPAFERHTGMSGALGRTIRELVPGIEPSWVQTYGRVARTGEPIRFEEHAASMGRWFDVFAFRVGQPGEHKVALLFSDVTQRKRVEEALREADARKDEFLATLAHELRNPLAPISNGLAILRHADPGSPVGVRARELMERQLVHLVRLVDDLLDVSRVSQGKVALKKATVSLNAVVDLALETSRPLIEAARHALSVELPQETVLLHADATRLAQVLGNLLNNAAKYTPEGGRIALRAERRLGERLQISVSDNGVGIPADMLGRVFELFTQVGSTLDRAQGGLGIGLSLARRLVEMHGGHLSADSAGPGRGSTFVVDLPIGPLPGAAPAAGGGVQEGRPDSAGHRRVLVVDDNVDAAETLALLLRMDGHEVHVVHDGLQAVAAAQARLPDLVFLDIGMPGLNGYEVATRLRAMPALAKTVLVAVTGWGTERDQVRARAAGIDGHLTKPVREEDLAGALELRR